MVKPIGKINLQKSWTCASQIKISKYPFNIKTKSTSHLIFKKQKKTQDKTSYLSEVLLFEAENMNQCIATVTTLW